MKENELDFNIDEIKSQINADDIFQIIKTDQSFHEGTGIVKNYIKKAKEIGVKNLVLADRNTLSAMVKFYKGCKEEGINPIIGATLRIEIPELDIERNVIKNKNNINILNNFANISNLGVDFNQLFLKEENFKELTNLQAYLLKYSKSKSKTKETILLKELNKSFSNILKKDFSIIGINIESVKKEEQSKEILSRLNTEELIDIMKNFDLELETSDLLVMAENDEGFKNIKELISLAYLKGQDNVKTTDKQREKREITSFPIITMKTLKENINGVRVYLGDKNDALGRAIISSNQSGSNVLDYYKKELEDKFYLYVKKSTKDDLEKNMQEELKLNKRLISIADEYSIPCVGTHDARFINEDDFYIHDIKRAILLKENVSAYNREKTEFTGQYLKSPEELMDSFSEYPELLLNNNHVSKNTNIFMKLNKNILPNFDIPKEFSDDVLVNHSRSINLISENEIKTSAELKAMLIEYYTEEIKEKFPEDEWEYEKENKINNIVSGKYMEVLAWDGVQAKMIKKIGEEAWAEKREEYHDRLKFETSVVNNMGFPGYFLIVQEFINWAKDNGVPVGPGRGSGAGSLLAFGMSITTLDPIKDDLLFERFLNPARVSMPDFDIDFGAGFNMLGEEMARSDVINHVKETYKNMITGQPTVGQIATNGEYGVKSGVKAVAKALGHTVTYETYLSKMIENIYSAPDIKFDYLFVDEDFKNKYDQESEFRKIINIAMALQGNKQNTGVHAGGVVIAPTTSSLSEFSSIQCSPNGTGLITQLDKDDVETAGLVKFDFLGLKTLSVIQEALKRINIDLPEKEKIDIDLIPEDDPATFKMLKAALTHGIFQIESAGMTKLVEDLQVEDIATISDLLALYRPGPMQSGMMDAYQVVRKNILQEHKNTGKPIKDISVTDIDLSTIPIDDRTSFIPVHDKLSSKLEATNNQMIYQEQVMQAGQILSGYSLGQADMLRRAMGKKKMSEMIIQKKMFSEGAFNTSREELKKKTLQSVIKKELDISLTDIKDKYQINDYIDFNKENDTSYFSSEEKIFDFFEKYLKYPEAKMEELKMSLAGYTISKFKEDHAVEIKNRIANKTKELGLNGADAEEGFYRMYYALSQFVRYNHIFAAIEKFAAYGFNKSHSLAYANVSYQTAYLKANHPVPFFAAVMTFQHDEHDKLNATVADAKKNFNITVLPADVNESEFLFKPNPKDGSIYFGFSAIKGLGVNGEAIYKERLLNGKFNDLQDLVLRTAYRNIQNKVKNSKLNSKGIEGLVYSGALDSFIPDYIINDDSIRSKKDYLLHAYEKIVDKSNYPAKDKLIKLVEHRIKYGEYPQEIKIDLDTLNNPNNISEFYIREIAMCKSSDFIKSKFDTINEKVEIISENLYNKNKLEDLRKNVIERTNVEKIYNLSKEKEFTGVYISEHPVNVNNTKESLRLDPSAILYDINKVTPEKDGDTVRVLGVLNEIRVLVTKKGKNPGQKMAILTLEDDTDKMNITIFPDDYKVASKHLVLDNLFAFEGQITFSEQYGLGLNAKSLICLPENNKVSFQNKEMSSKYKY